MADGVSGEHPQIVRASDDAALEAPRHAVRGSHERSAPRESFPHASKFRAALAMLAGFAIGALVVAAVIVINGRSSSSTAAWSSWQPADSGTLGAREIADHVAPLYRISGTDQLAVVTVVNLANSTAAQAAAQSGVGNSASSGLQVAVRADPSSSALSLLTGNTIAYNLCGVGSSNCSIGVGQPSANRLLLLRREALELALYTFRYISGTQNVVALLPPGHTTQACTLCAKPNQHAVTKPLNIALLFLHDELQPWLSQPLAQTLPESFPPTVDQMRAAPEAPLVEQITARGTFSENVEQAQDGSNLVVLTPLAPQ
jgi:hypothetical protein